MRHSTIRARRERRRTEKKILRALRYGAEFGQFVIGLAFAYAAAAMLFTL